MHSGQPVDARTVPAALLQRALTDANIPAKWSVSEAIFALAPTDVGLQFIPRTASVRDGFRNQLVGRIAEVEFEEKHLEPLSKSGYIWKSHYLKGDNRDYSLSHPSTSRELSINVKTASTMFRQAKTVVQLDPLDCAPISIYKALGGSKSWPDLIYADLIDFNLRAKADSLIEQMGGDEALLWDLFSWYGGKGAKDAEDAYIGWAHTKHKSSMQGLIDKASGFKVISAKRAIAIEHSIPRRCPGLGIKGGFGEVNVHVSVGSEMTPWIDVERILVSGGGIDEISSLVLHEVQRTVPDPLL